MDASTDRISSVSNIIKLYDENYYQAPNKFEVKLKEEFLLLIQYLFMHDAPSCTLPDEKWCERFLSMCEGTDLYQVRCEVIKRLFSVQNMAPPIEVGELSLDQYPSQSELKRWRSIAKLEFERSRKVFKTTETKDILWHEENTTDFYKALNEAYPREEEEVDFDVHYQSHVRVAECLREMMGERSQEKVKIIDYGCGDGRLLYIMRKYFPQAELIGTNVFGDYGVLEAVKNDPNTKIVNTDIDGFGDDIKFDAVVSTEVIEHLVVPSSLIKKTNEVLKDGGCFIFTAPSLHVEFLQANIWTYFWSLVSTLFPSVLPPFHNMWQSTLDLKVVHYAFSFSQYRSMFRSTFPKAQVVSLRFTHLKKFRLDGLARYIPIVNRWGGLLMAYGKK